MRLVCKLTIQIASTEFVVCEESSKTYRYLRQTLLIWYIWQVNFLQIVRGFTSNVFTPTDDLKSQGKYIYFLFDLLLILNMCNKVSFNLLILNRTNIGQPISLYNLFITCIYVYQLIKIRWNNISIYTQLKFNLKLYH